MEYVELKNLVIPFQVSIKSLWGFLRELNTKQLLRNDVDVTDMRDYPTLHVDTD